MKENIWLVIAFIIFFPVLGESSGKKASKVDAYLNGSFDSSLSKLPHNFKGHNIVKLYNGLSEFVSDELDEKSEFETTKQYQNRIASGLRKPYYGKCNLDSQIAFEIPLAKEYNADTQVFKAAIMPGTRWFELKKYDSIEGYQYIFVKKMEKISHYIGSNVFGVTAEVTKINEDSYYIKYKSLPLDKNNTYTVTINTDEAKQLKLHLKAIVIGKIVRPFTSYVGHYIAATFTEPTEYYIHGYYIYFEPKELWFVNDSSGIIIDKVDLSDR